MFSFSFDWSLCTDCTERIFHFNWRIKKFLTFITLVSSSIIKFTERAGSSNKSISQEHITILTITLFHGLFNYLSILINIEENLLTDFSMPLSTCSSKIVKSNIEPLINIFVNLMIVITDLLRGFLLLKSFDFSCCTILVSSTHI